MRIVKFTVSLITLVALLAPASMASGFQHFGIGVKARAMGGAFRATADDWTAAYYNPAGYAFVQDNQLGGNLSVFHLRNEIVPNYRWDNQYSTGMFNDRVNFNKHEYHNIPAGGFITRLPIWGETVVGFSSFQAFDNNMTWFLYDFPAAYNDILSLPKHQYRSDIDVVSFQITAAREFSEKLSLGIGLELLRGDMVYNDVSFLNNPMPEPYSDRPLDFIPRLSSNDGRGWGFGVRLGVLWKPVEKMSVGLTAHVPSNITISGTTVHDFYMPNLEFSNFAPGEIEYLFTAGELYQYSADFEAELSLPASFGFGFSYDVTEKLNVEFDGEYTLWSSFESLDFTYSEQEDIARLTEHAVSEQFFYHDNSGTQTDWENSGKLMLGASYQLSNVITLLAGGSADQSPLRGGELVGPYFIDTGDKYSYSGGVIFHINQWDVGIAQTYISSPDLTVYSLVDANDDSIVDNFAGDYTAQTYETVLSINYRF